VIYDNWEGGNERRFLRMGRTIPARLAVLKAKAMLETPNRTGAIPEGLVAILRCVNARRSALSLKVSLSLGGCHSKPNDMLSSLACDAMLLLG
jgi:hypothetical protein